MEPQVYNLIKKIHDMLHEKEASNLTSQELAYITGLLESALTIFSEAEIEVPIKKGFGLNLFK